MTLFVFFFFSDSFFFFSLTHSLLLLYKKKWGSCREIKNDKTRKRNKKWNDIKKKNNKMKSVKKNNGVYDDIYVSADIWHIYKKVNFLQKEISLFYFFKLPNTERERKRNSSHNTKRIRSFNLLNRTKLIYSRLQYKKSFKAGNLAIEVESVNRV